MRLLDGAAEPISFAAGLGTESKDDVIYTPVILIPTTYVTVPPAIDERRSAVTGQGLVPVQMESSTPLGTLFRANLPIPESQKAAVKSADRRTKETTTKRAAKCAVPASKATLPEISMKDFWAGKVGKVVLKKDSQKAAKRAAVPKICMKNFWAGGVVPKEDSQKAAVKRAAAKTGETTAAEVAAKCAVPPSKAAVPKVCAEDFRAGGAVPRKDWQTPIINCDDCEFTAISMLSMVRHYKAKHPDGLKDIRFSCFHCNYVGKCKSHIQRHILDVHLKLRNKQVTCGICWRNYCSKRAVQRHIERNHLSSNENGAEGAAECPKGKWNYGYCCDVCGRGYEKQLEVLAHRDVYHASSPQMRWSDFQKIKGKMRSCEKCKGLYRVGHFFEEHSCIGREENTAFEGRMKEALGANPCFRCDICSFSSAWKLVVRQHREKKHADAAAVNWDELVAFKVPHYCIHCYKAFDEEAEAAQHFCAEMEMETKPKLYVCSVCDVSFPRRAAYRRHSQIRHGIYDEDGGGEEGAIVDKPRPAVQCPYCEHADTSRARMVAHIKEAHDVDTDSPYMCVPCCRVFQRKAILDAHNQIYHPKNEDMSADNERILAENQILVNGEVTYHCSECNRNYEHAMRFLTHYRLHFVERRFTCHLCGKQTRTQNHLKTHIRNSHLDIRNYECDICHKSYHSKLVCEQHRRIHTGERPFSCEICGKTFSSNSALLSHKKFHDDFFPHECHLCPKKFKIRRCLINHIRIHTGERPFKCELCSKTFSDPSRFSYHKKVTHSDERRVQCKVCGNRYKANKYLTRHMKSQHPDA